MGETEQSNSQGWPSLDDVFGVVTEAQTYKNLVYLALAFPLGLAYFVVLTIGVTLGLSLAVVGVGIGILLVVVLGARFLAAFERRLAVALLDSQITAPDDVTTSEGLWPTAKSYLSAASTWKGVAFLYLKFSIGIVAFILLVTTFSITGSLVTAPLHYDTEIVTVGFWTVDTLAEALAVVPVGVAVGIGSLHLLNGAARVSGHIATALLGGASSSAAGQTATTE